MDRKLATVETISDIIPIDGADRIVQYQVKGWKVVDQIDKYQIGDTVIFCEVDSFIPHSLVNLTGPDRDPKEYKGVSGERLRTIRLRKALSQGLLISYDKLVDATGNPFRHFNTGEDVTDILGIIKWEPAEPGMNAGMTKGNFPGWIRKTDQERVQNLGRDLDKWIDMGYTFRAQEKLEGSSMTVYLKDGEFGVCSRNWDLKDSEDNSFWQAARRVGLQDKLNWHVNGGSAIVLQGELIGPGIQGNIYNLSEKQFHLFDGYTNGERWDEGSVAMLASVLGVPMVPQLGLIAIESVEQCLEFAEGKSALNPKVEREGVVFRCVQDPNITFKAISNKYLLKQKD